MKTLQHKLRSQMANQRNLSFMQVLQRDFGTPAVGPPESFLSRFQKIQQEALLGGG
jgi:hypothetical protein